PGEAVPRRTPARAPRRDDGADLDLRGELLALVDGPRQCGDPARAEPGRAVATGSAAASRAGRRAGDRGRARDPRVAGRADVRPPRGARLRLAAGERALLSGAAGRRVRARYARREPGGTAVMTTTMVPDENDVIVVGGGPAGSTTAAFLARAGR